jgi:hypothetical protein
MENNIRQVQLSLQQSKGINQVVSKNYRAAWKELGCLFYELLKENSNGMMKLYKKGSDGSYFSKEVSPSDWKSPNGYEVVVKNEAEASAADDFDLKKIQYVKNVFANNPVAQSIVIKTLELLEWSSQEVDSVMAENPQPQTMPVDAPSKVNNPQDSIKSSNANNLKL